MKNLYQPIATIIIFLLFFSGSNAQNTTLPLGGWRDHTPFNKAISIAEDDKGLIYCASQFGLFTYARYDGEINILSRLKELSDLEIDFIRFDPVSKVMMIAYLNSNIDLIYPDKRVVNIPDIKQKNIIGGKRINSVLFLNNFAYLGCEFGIVVVDLTREEINATYYIGPNGENINVNGVAFDGTYLLAATDTGIFKAQYYNNPFIFDYHTWFKDTTLFEPNGMYTSATSLNGKFYVVKTSLVQNEDTVFVFDNNQWTPFVSDFTSGAHVDTYNNYIVLLNSYRFAKIDNTGAPVGEISIYNYDNASIKNGYLSDDGTIWVADFKNGLVFRKPGGNIQIACPNGPRSEASWAVAGRDGRLWVASGALAGDAPNYDIKNGISRFADNNWHTFDCTNDTIYQGLCNNGSKSVICVTIDPKDADHAFIGCWGNGLLEYRKDGGVKKYDESNSAIHAKTNLPGYILTGGVTYDDDGNLWVVAGGSPQGISSLESDGTWQDFTIPDIDVSNYGLYGLVVDDFGQKWFIAHEGASTGQGLCVFKENDLHSSGNCSFKRLIDKDGAGALPHIFVRSIAKDKDGAIWIGTDAGVGVIYNPGNVFTGGSYDAEKVILQQDGYNQYLLETEIVTAIAVDGANRKWFGTYNGGAFLMSPDGTHQILNFNIDNSPIPSNSIIGIAIDDKTGEVFFGTDKGITSYRGDATEGGTVCNDYYAFPNPVKHDYRGPIAIRGLVANADVKISDVSGNVVYHVKSNGGEAIWYGNNFKGERVQTGVYIVYVTNDDGSSTCTTKILFAN